MTKRKFTRVSTIQGLVNALAAHGVDANALCQRMSLPESILSDGSNVLLMRDFAKLLKEAVRESRNPRLLYDMVSNNDSAFAGMLGLLMQTAPKFEDALEIVSQYIALLTESISWELVTGEETSKLILHLDDDDLTDEFQPIISELALAECYRILCIVLQNDFQLKRVQLKTAPTVRAQDIEEFFNATVICNRAQAYLEFDNSYLSRPACHSNEMLHEVVKAQIAATSAVLSTPSLAKRVKDVIRKKLPAADLGEISSSLGQDRRTVQRQLRSLHNTTYKELLQEVRMEQAKYYLAETNEPVTRIAYQLGFSDPANLTRAFKASFGCTPKAWRQSIRQEDGAAPSQPPVAAS